ncbi:hypothetical protein IR010_18565 [Flavobacterium sp. MR2016-29]|uniref:hypothetical protein n=1 Tax=Flavobacterium sp. MR2016-29 TaxID=2783795 RepID=UPI00188CF854|nr:hypothetical protein [Flavobacterium sp. MR2016-29]MBF4494551.1 hypothetical protein [Flavobacterium sp. MR2016-29]
MKYFFNEIIQRPTVFSILGMLAIISGIPFTLYALTLNGGAMLGALFSFGLVIISLIFMSIDRVLVEKINLKIVNILEIIILILLYFFLDISN